MAWSTPSSRTTGTLITAAIWNQDVVNNPIALRAGAVAIASQAADDFIYASSASQLGRIAKVANSLPVYGAAWALLGRAACVAYNNAAQSVASDNAYHTLALNAEDVDSASMHDPVTNNSRVTVPRAGIYLAAAYSGPAASNTGSKFRLMKNGATVIRESSQPDNGSFGECYPITAVLSLAASDYLEVSAAHSSVTANWGNAARQFSTELAVAQLFP